VTKLSTRGERSDPAAAGEFEIQSGPFVDGVYTGDGISNASHVKNLKARATTFYNPVHNARVDIMRLSDGRQRKPLA
jgi:hypothetical protein